MVNETVSKVRPNLSERPRLNAKIGGITGLPQPYVLIRSSADISIWILPFFQLPDCFS